MTDAVIIARGERNDRAYVPDLPGCMATGKTREDTTRGDARRHRLPQARAEGGWAPHSRAHHAR
jgi:hypothetical protein